MADGQPTAGQTKGRQMIFTDMELAVIKATFKDNEPLLKLLRKVFLPEYDPNAPLGQAFDLWLTLNVAQMDPLQAQVHILARNSLITHIDQQLIQLDYLARMETPTPEAQASKAKADSAK
jgi:hypothetical protein